MGVVVAKDPSCRWEANGAIAVLFDLEYIGEAPRHPVMWVTSSGQRELPDVELRPLGQRLIGTGLDFALVIPPRYFLEEQSFTVSLSDVSAPRDDQLIWTQVYEASFVDGEPCFIPATAE